MALPKPMKAMKAATAAAAQRGGPAKKAMKGVMKRKSISTIGRGRLAKALVLRGSKVKTTGGLKAEDLMKNKRGKVVSKRQSALGKRRFKNIEAWVQAHMAARNALHVNGWCAVNGKTVQGKAIYVKAKAILAGNARSTISRSPPARSPVVVKEAIKEEEGAASAA